MTIFDQINIAMSEMMHMNKIHTLLPFVIISVIMLLSSNFQYVSAEIPSLDTAKLRFSQNFFTIFTILPLSMIGLGGVIIFYGLYEKKIQKNDITNKLILIGSIIILLGFVMFIFYLID